MQGLPYSSSESEITRFFQEAGVTPIRIHRKHNGGEAYVEFNNVFDAKQAMTKHKQNIGRRYIDLFRVSYQEMAEVVGLPSSRSSYGSYGLGLGLNQFGWTGGSGGGGSSSYLSGFGSDYRTDSYRDSSSYYGRR